ncbi:MAG: NifU N-terminal domain-containing protein [Actinomycetes bacterium]|jgi:hypothetical protein|nr:MAG: scaffolding protein [Actinomycetota bacterium]
MPVVPSPTPNPAAMKFTVGAPVGGPATVRPNDDATGFAADIAALDGVTSVFFTADFVTVTKDPSASWDDLVPEVVAILERAFPG